MTTPGPETELLDDAARRLILEATRRTLFVDAGAGSGKTRALVDRVRTLVLRDDVPIENIAAVTFTEKAAAELTERLRGTFERTAHDHAATDHDRERAAQALDELDLAAIGTLHSYAQRILALHPIEARIPPHLQVLDEVGSTAASEERWAVIQSRLLDDDTIGDILVPALAMGVKLTDLHSLARAFNNDWDLAEDRLGQGPPAPVVPDTAEFYARAAALAERRVACFDPEADKLYPHLEQLAGLVAEHQANLSIEDQHLLLGRIVKVGGTNKGNKTLWSVPVAQLRSDLKDLMTAAESLARDLVDAVLRPLAHWVGRRVVEAAQERAATGELEFHDLLVVARRLLREDAEVCRSLRHQFPYLLLDEFQDTDPIQIELALRIAGGDTPNAGQDVSYDVPPGSLFVVGDPKQSIYRFRRADITRYLQTQQRLGETVRLSTNFRSAGAVITWVNRIFSSMITEIPDQQPAYEPLAVHRGDPEVGAAVSVVGLELHPKQDTADRVRALEAVDVAASIRRAVDEGWTVADDSRPGRSRPIEHRDIAILIPAKTSLGALEDALEDAGIPYRAESSSLVYQSSEVRDLLNTVRTVADATDELSLVAVLRSPLFGLADDELWTWRRGHGRFRLFAAAPEGLEEHPVAEALAYLQGLRRRLRTLTPAEVLGTIIAERRMLEVAATQQRTRDSWRRLRFVVDQARAWSEAQHGGLRSYLSWVSRQAEDGARVAEAVLPETDVDAVRVMTIHGAKGLEFPMVIVSGLSSQPRRTAGVKLLWPPDGGLAVKLNQRIQTNDFDAASALDEQMDAEEKKRLLYVACTRAQDHLVVSLHRRENINSLSAVLTEHGAGNGMPELVRDVGSSPSSRGSRRAVAPPPPWDGWLGQVTAARASAQRDPAQNASGLEGTDAKVVLGSGSADAGLAKDARDVELPPWSKGRYGSAIGSAVHAVLQSVDLATGAGLEGAVQAACLAEGVLHETELVTGLVRSALESEVVRRAAAREHWRESWLASAQDDGTVLEGIADLIYREDDGSLVIIDYKTDAVPGPAIHKRVDIYRPQLRAYARMLGSAVGSQPELRLLFLRPETSMEERI